MRALALIAVAVLALAGCDEERDLSKVSGEELLKLGMEGDEDAVKEMENRARKRAEERAKQPATSN